MLVFATTLAAGAVGAPADDASAAESIEEGRRLVAEADKLRDGRRLDEAVAAYEKAIALLERGDAGREPIAEALNGLGRAHLDRGRPGDALAAFRRALDLRRQLHEGDHRDVTQSLNNMATALDGLGRPADALPLYEEALAMRRRLFEGRDHPDVATSLNNLASTLYALGRPADALRLNEEAMAMRRRLFEGDHPEIARDLNNLAMTLAALGRHADALPRHEEALAMWRRLHAVDHPDVATGLNNLALTLDALGRPSQALPLKAESLAMRRRLFRGDHPDVASSINNLASTLEALGRTAEARPLYEESLGMYRRLYRGDHPAVALALNNLAVTLHPADALPLQEESLAMYRRLFRGDHPYVALSLGAVAHSLDALGRPAAALPFREESLAMTRRLFEGDHPYVAQGLNDLAFTLRAVGRAADALPLHEESVAMNRRLYSGDHPDLALSLDTMATTLVVLGRPADALPLHEEAVAMCRRLYKGDHPSIAKGLDNVAAVLGILGRPGEALPLKEESLDMYRRLYGNDHPRVAQGLNNLAYGLEALGRPADALPLYEEALAMSRRLFPGDHPGVAMCLGNLAGAVEAVGRPQDALVLKEDALAMYRRLYGDDHPDVARAVNNVASTLDSLGRSAEAVPLWRESADIGARVGWPWRHVPLTALGRCALRAGDAAAAIAPLAEAVAHLEALRSEAGSLDAEEGARYAATARLADPFPLLVEAQVALGAPGDALGLLERGRARAILELLEGGRRDPLAEAVQRARAAGDEEAVARLDSLAREIREAEAALVQCGGDAERARAAGVLAQVRAAHRAESEARRALEKAMRDRRRLLRDALPETRPLAAREMQALLGPGERMLVYGLGDRASFVFLVRPEGEEIEAVRLPAAPDRLSGIVAAHVHALAKPGADPAIGRQLFDAIVPPRVWAEVRKARRLYVLPHGQLHRVAFETLVVEGGRYWIDDGPPIAYAASGSVLAWLKSRRGASSRGADLVAVADPSFVATDAVWPEKGVLVRDVVPGGQAADLGLRPGDVVIRYGEREVADLASLRAALGKAGEGAPGAVSLRFLREGEEKTVAARPGKLGVYLAEEPPTISGPALVAGRQVTTGPQGGALVPLPGTRREVSAIRDAFVGARPDARVVTLLGAEATESRLFEAAGGARHLHLATHGVGDETGRASPSALALAKPRVPVPGDDGFLTLADLLERWRGRLDGTALVVLSACETQRGRLERDEGMFALPLGFCFAGSPAVVASLWRVDDESTALLMADLYRRLLAEAAPGPCEALHAARVELRRKRPDPFHWGAFVYIGAP